MNSGPESSVRSFRNEMDFYRAHNLKWKNEMEWIFEDLITYNGKMKWNFEYLITYWLGGGMSYGVRSY